MQGNCSRDNPARAEKRMKLFFVVRCGEWFYKIFCLQWKSLYVVYKLHFAK